MKKNPVVHFEMPYKNAKRVSNFYTSAFGWGMNDAGEGMGHYVIAQTADTDKDQMVKKPGTINGGFYQYNAKNPALQYPNVVIAVTDLKKAMNDVVKAGGKVLGGQKKGVPDDIPGIGLYCAFLDSEGNRVGMLQPSPLM